MRRHGAVKLRAQSDRVTKQGFLSPAEEEGRDVEEAECCHGSSFPGLCSGGRKVQTVTICICTVGNEERNRLN